MYPILTVDLLTSKCRNDLPVPQEILYEVRTFELCENGVLNGDCIPSVKSPRQALEQECCLLDVVLCVSGNEPANL